MKVDEKGRKRLKGRKGGWERNLQVFTVELGASLQITHLAWVFQTCRKWFPNTTMFAIAKGGKIANREERRVRARGLQGATRIRFPALRAIPKRCRRFALSPHSKTLPRLVNAHNAFCAINAINAVNAINAINAINAFYALQCCALVGSRWAVL